MKFGTKKLLNMAAVVAVMGNEIKMYPLVVKASS